MPASAIAIRSLQRALLDVCVQQIEDVAEAVELWQRLDQVLADALIGRAVAATEAAGATRPVADDAARRAVAEPSPEPAIIFPPKTEAAEPADPAPALHVKQPLADPEPEPEPPLVITDEPRPPATPRAPPPKARRVDDPPPSQRAWNQPWTAEEDAKIIAWQADGKSVRWIAEQIGRSLGATQVRISKVRAAAKAGPQKRRCLNCSRLFVSNHIGNRLCSRCDGRTEGLAA